MVDVIASTSDAPNLADRPWHEWTWRAETIASELTATAVDRDRRNAAPLAEIDLLRKSDLLAALHPTSLGGGGLTWPQALRLVRIIARGDSSIGQLLGYHYINSQVPFLAFAPRAEELGRETVASGLYWGAAVNPRDPHLVLKRDGDHYRVNGRKTFSTGARVANRLNVLAILDDRIVHFIAPTDRPGIVANNDWDNFGQRLSDSGSIDFNDYRITEADFLLPPAAPTEKPLPSASLNTPLIQLVFTNFYLGTAEGALAQARDYVRTTTRPWETSGVSSAVEDPYILERFGEFSTELAASIALAEDAAVTLQAAVERGQHLTERERGEAAIPVYRAKVHSTKVALELTSRIFEVMGARATASRHGFDRFWRNIRTHTLHDPVYYKARDVGAFVLSEKLPRVDLYT